MDERVRIKNAKLVFSNLFTPVGYKGSDVNKSFTAKVLIEKGSEDDDAIMAAIEKVAAAAYDKQAPKKLKQFASSAQTFPYRDGDSTGYESNEGFMVLTANLSEEKAVAIEKSGEIALLVQDIDGCRLKTYDGSIDAEDMVFMAVDIYAQKGANEGIRCVLRAIRVKQKGERATKASPRLKVTEEEFADLIVPAKTKSASLAGLVD